jgi:hypothetical protein
MSQEPRVILYRILGNDLPPRHSPGQTLANLRHLLAHEPPLPGLEKRWLLNRIVDPELESQLREAIAPSGQRIDAIPFRFEDYRKIWCDLGTTPEDRHPWSEGFAALDPVAQARGVDYIGRHKNRYAMNNNGARNMAIRLGLADAAWVFPWDGGCLLPAYAWEVLRPLTAIEGLSYLVVPMVRLRGGELPSREPQVGAVQRDEPQLGFSRGARLHFDDTLRYGSMPKAMLLRRIGLPGPWQDWRDGTLPWEETEQEPAPDAGRFLQAGVVFRLGAEGQDERHVDLAALQTLRFDSIRRFTRRLDLDSLSRFLAARPLRCWTGLDGDGASEAVRQAVAQQARLARHPITGPPAGGASWGELPVNAICALALDHHLQGTPASLESLGALIRAWFLADRSALNPGSAAPLSPPGRAPSPQGLAALPSLPPLLDALNLARRNGALSPVELQAVDSAIDALFNWLCTDSGAFLRAHRQHPSATTYHLDMLTVAAYLGQTSACAQVIDNLPGLLSGLYQMDGAPRDGNAPQPTGAASAAAQLDHLLSWAQLAVLTSCLGRDLMARRDEVGHGLMPVFAHAQRFLKPQLVDPEQRACWAGIAWMIEPQSPASEPPIQGAAALPPFAGLSRRLVPLPSEPLDGVTVETPRSPGQAAPRGGRP